MPPCRKSVIILAFFLTTEKKKLREREQNRERQGNRNSKMKDAREQDEGTEGENEIHV